MKSREQIKAALRILTACNEGRTPTETDVMQLQIDADPQVPLEELARKMIQTWLGTRPPILAGRVRQ